MSTIEKIQQLLDEIERREQKRIKLMVKMIPGLVEAGDKKERVER